MTLPTDARAFAHVAVVGPGAIGCVLAVYLAGLEGGPRVTLIDHRPDRAARLSAAPLVLETPEGEVEARVPVATAPATAPDLVLLATKAHDAARAAAAAAAWAPAASVVALQNGLGVADEVRAAVGAGPVLTAVSYQAATRLSEGRVRHVASLVTYVGYDAGPPDATARAVADLLTRAGLPAEAEADVRHRVWEKLIVNVAINPVAGLAGEPNGAVASRPTLRALAAALVEEAVAVATAEGARLPEGDPLARVLATARRTAANRCSMLQDLEAGRATEIDYLNGAVVGRAEAHGLAAPTHRAMAALVRQVSAAAREGGS